MKGITGLHVELGMRILVIIGGLSHLAFGLGYKHAIKAKFISLIIGICAVSLAFNRDFYLPFLGQTVLPIVKEVSHIQLGTTESKVQLSKLPPNSKVIYWAAMPGKDTLTDPFAAYGDYSNSGVVVADEKGEAELKLNCPMQYKVRGKTLHKHVHYRVEDPKMKGMFSRIYTKKLDC